MLKNHSKPYSLFLDSFEIKDRQSSEDYNIEALLQLDTTELAIAEDLLINTLLEGSDARAPRALYYIKSHKAIPALKNAIQSKTGLMLLECAFTLWRLEKDESLVKIFITLLNDKDAIVRLSAAAILCHFNSNEVTESLCNVLKADPNNLVRANALESLYKIYGLLDWDIVPGRGVGLLRLRLSSIFPSIRQNAIAELNKIGEGKKQGKTAEELGITVVDSGKSEAAKELLISFSSSVSSSLWGDNFNLAALDKLEGEEKEWAIYTLFFLLQRGDYRAAKALTHLRYTQAIEPFRQLLKTVDKKMAAELNIGIVVLAIK